MIKKLGIFFFIISVSAILVTFAQAEMAKEGSGEYRSSKTTTFNVLSMENERVQMNIEQVGVVVSAPENSPLYNASFRCIGTLHAIKGKHKGSGFLVYSNPNNDKIYATFEAEGVMGVTNKAKLTFVGGTGACTGIQGTLELTGNSGIKSSKKGTAFGISEGKFNWKIP